MKGCFGMLILFASACGSSGGGGGNPDAAAPTISVTAAPANGTAVKNDNTTANGITLTVTSSGITLVDPNMHTTDVAGEGHFHVYLDSETSYLTYAFTSPLPEAIPARVTASAAPGTPHTLHLVLETNTHNPIAGAAPSNTIMFNVVQ